MNLERSGSAIDLLPKERELLADIAAGRVSNYYDLSRGRKWTANHLQKMGLIDTGRRDKREMLALTESGKALASHAAK